MTSEKGLAKSTAIISSGIMTSRILGFIRDVLIANFFGTGLAAQAFVMAFTVPNVLRQLVAEGTVNSVLVPVLTEYRAKKEKREFFRFANILLNQFLVILLLITVIGIFITPFLMRIIAPGFVIDPAKFSLTVDLTRILFPYILFVGLSAYCMGVLNTFNHFAAPAYASTVWNATVIIAMLIFFHSFEITHLVLAVLAGGVLQFLFQLLPLLKRGPFFNVRAGFFHKGAGGVGRLLLPRIVGAGIYEINIIVDRMLASLQLIVGRGAVAALYYGNRLFQLPLALFGIAIATAALPMMSLLAVEKNVGRFKQALSISIRNMIFLSLPASVGLMVMAKPIIKVIFERGEFTSYATDITSSVLFFYAMGIAAYGGVRILVSAFHAMQDTLTPVKIACVALLLNIVLNVILMVPLKAGGLALATSIAGFVNFAFLFVILKNRIGLFEGKDIALFLLKVSAASIFMGLIAYMIRRNVGWDGGIKDALNLVLIILTSIAAYLGASSLLRIKEARILFSWIKRD